MTQDEQKELLSQCPDAVVWSNTVRNDKTEFIYMNYGLFLNANQVKDCEIRDCGYNIEYIGGDTYLVR